MRHLGFLITVGLLLFVLVLLQGCTAPTTMVTPMNAGGVATGYYIDCTLDGFQGCIHKANKVCPSGWEPQHSEAGGAGQTFGYSQFGGGFGINQLSSKRLIVSCK